MRQTIYLLSSTISNHFVTFPALIYTQQAEDQPVDDGNGKLTVWVVKDFKKELVDPAQHG